MPDAGSAFSFEQDPDARPEGFPGAAGLVHDLGNLIQIAASAVNLLGRSPRPCKDAALEPVLARAKTALERAGALVRQSRGRVIGPGFEIHATPELQSVPACLAEIHALICWICEPNIALSIEVPADLPLVRCNRIELQNAVLNLVINARDAMPDGGSIRILARPSAHREFADGVELSVADDGPGMTKDTLALAFAPYFTTKPDGRGSGLGLAMVRRFAENAGGRADITSRPGEGTAVTLFLPSADQAPQSARN